MPRRIRMYTVYRKIYTPKERRAIIKQKLHPKGFIKTKYYKFKSEQTKARIWRKGKAYYYFSQGEPILIAKNKYKLGRLRKRTEFMWSSVFED